MDGMYEVTSDGTMEEVWGLVRQVNTLRQSLLETRLLRAKLTPERLEVLRACAGKERYPADVARIVGRASQSMAGLLNRMEGEGLLIRNPKRPGHPLTTLHVTETGMELLAAGEVIVSRIAATDHDWLEAEIRTDMAAVLRDLRGKLADETRTEIVEQGE